MDGDDDSFALLLAHEYTENSIRNLGWGALKGVDSARYHALDGANAVVSKEKQLLFFIVQLRHDAFYHFDGCDYTKRGHADSITWYTVAGDALGTVSSVKQKINFLNPRQELLNQLWVHFGTLTKEGGYLGNQGSTCMTTYTRCAIVAWQKIKHPEKAMKLMPPSAAAQVLHSIETVNGTLVRQLLEAAANRTAAENTIREYDSDRKKVKLSLEFFRLVCKLLPKAGDSEVVVLFFKNYCPLLGGVKGNEAFIPSLTEIIRAFDWLEIGEAVLASMESKDKKGGLSPMEMALYVLDGQDSGVAQEALLKMAVEKAGAMDDSTLFMSDAIGLLWKWVARSEDKSLFDSIAKKLTNAETSLVGSSIQYLSQYLSASEKEKLAVVRPIVVTRATWLEDEIKALDKKFTWEMPDASVQVR